MQRFFCNTGDKELKWPVVEGLSLSAHVLHEPLNAMVQCDPPFPK